jgi:hypothetical protein
MCKPMVARIEKPRVAFDHDVNRFVALNILCYPPQFNVVSVTMTYAINAQVCLRCPWHHVELCIQSSAPQTWHQCTQRARFSERFACNRSRNTQGLQGHIPVSFHEVLTNGGGILLKFSTRCSSTIAEHRTNLLGGALCVQRKHRNMHRDLKFSTRCSSIVATHLATLAGGAFCAKSNNIDTHAQLYAFSMCLWTHNTQPTKFALCFVTFDNTCH